MRPKKYNILAKPHRRTWVHMPKRVQEYVIDQVKAGRTCVSLAKELKMNNCSIHFFLKRRGLSVAALKKEGKGKEVNPTIPASKPLTAAYEAKTRHFKAFTLDAVSVATLKRLAFYLGVEPHEVAKAAIQKYEDLQKQIVREMLAK